jgi:Fe2+ or Zn2+ uptake regulation protein
VNTSTTEAVSNAILKFFEHRREHGPFTFYADDLRRWVQRQITVAPATPDRILRLLRQQGRLNYTVANRAKSIYYIPETQPTLQSAALPCS